MRLEINADTSTGHPFIVTKISEDSPVPYRDNEDDIRFAIKLCNLAVANLECRLETLDV